MTSGDTHWLETLLRDTPRRRLLLLYKALNAQGLRIGAGLDAELEQLEREAASAATENHGSWSHADGMASYAWRWPSCLRDQELWEAAHVRHGAPVPHHECDGTVDVHTLHCPCGAVFVAQVTELKPDGHPASLPPRQERA